MTLEHQPSEKQYLAVVNGEGQHSIWSACVALPAGWVEAGKRGTREECLTFITQVWTDMRPQSLRDQMILSVHADKLKV